MYDDGSSARKLRSRSQFVHAGREDLRELGVHAPPLDLSSTYPLGDSATAAESLGAMAHGGRPVGGEAVYSRLHNPTVARFEGALAGLEGCAEAVAFASGMAALHACLLAAGERHEGPDAEVVATRPLYGGSEHLAASGAAGLAVRWVDDLDGLAAACGPRTAIVLVETPANPTLALRDLDAVVAAANGAPLLVDNTFATPVLQRPARHGAALVLHSATKFLGGHGDVLAGAVACDADWAAALRRQRVATGAVLQPLSAWLLHRGLPTLPLRVEAAQHTATQLAEWLAQQSGVVAVHHPSRPGADPDRVMGRQMAGPGAVLAFELEGGREAAQSFLRGLRLATPAVSLGSVDTLVQHPASLTHQVVGEASREASGIVPGLLRVSVGLEDFRDLRDDFCGALAGMAATVG